MDKSRVAAGHTRTTATGAQAKGGTFTETLHPKHASALASTVTSLRPRAQAVSQEIDRLYTAHRIAFGLKTFTAKHGPILRAEIAAGPNAYECSVTITTPTATIIQNGYSDTEQFAGLIEFTHNENDWISNPHSAVTSALETIGLRPEEGHTLDFTDLWHDRQLARPDQGALGAALRDARKSLGRGAGHDHPDRLLRRLLDDMVWLDAHTELASVLGGQEHTTVLLRDNEIVGARQYDGHQATLMSAEQAQETFASTLSAIPNLAPSSYSLGPRRREARFINPDTAGQIATSPHTRTAVETALQETENFIHQARSGATQ